MTYRQALLQARKMLLQAQIEEADVDGRLLLDYVCGTDYGWYFLHQNEEMPAEEEKRYSDLIRTRSRHVPLQYITGEQEFMGLPIKVSPDVLIPRQDTEVLAELSIDIVRPGDRVLDLCTGSGCLAIAIAHYCPQAQVTASDISEAALSLARENASENGCNVLFLCSNLFEAIGKTYDVIVSNPPYIESAVIETLSPEVREHEPRTALDGGADGLFFYRHIVYDGRNHIGDGGWLLMEIGADQGEPLTKLLHDAGYRNVSIRKDLAGLDRVAVGQR